MRVLIIHNRYTKRGGEEQVVQLQKTIFESNGHEVLLYEKQNRTDSSIKDKLSRFFRGFWNRRTEKEVKELVKTFSPDFCIVHNLFHLLTPSVLSPLKKASVPVVMVLHNYRLLCPIGILYRKGHLCAECVIRGSREWRCAVNNCAENRFNSLFFAVRSKYIRNKRLLDGKVDAFVALSKFQKEYIQSKGYSDTYIEVIPNSLPLISTLPEAERSYIGFSGRMTQEKGIDIFLDLALRMPEMQFHIAGENSLSDKIVIPKNVIFCGFLQGEELDKFYRDALFIMLASRWYEGFPMVILEAFRQQTPAIVPDIGALASIVDDGVNGLVYNIEDIDTLIKRLHEVDRCTLGANAYQKFLSNYNETTYYKQFMTLYEQIKK